MKLNESGTYDLSRRGISLSRIDGANGITIPSEGLDLNSMIINKIRELNLTSTVTQLRFELWTVITWQWVSGERVIKTYVDMSTGFASGNRMLATIPIVYIPRPTRITVAISDGTSQEIVERDPALDNDNTGPSR